MFYYHKGTQLNKCFANHKGTQLNKCLLPQGYPTKQMFY